MEALKKKCGFALFWVFMLASSWSVFGQGSQNVILLSNWDNNALPDITGASYNDVWGYAANGREYAFIGVNAGVYVFDVTIPTSPVQIQFLAGGSNSSKWRDMKTYQNYMYAIADAGAGASLQIYDLTNLPVSVTKVYDSQTLFSTAHNLFVSESTGRMYVAGASTQPNGVLMLDISNPTNPTQLASYTLGAYTHDVYVHNDTLYAFLTNVGGVAAFDLSSLSYPYAMGDYNYYPNQGYTHSGWASADNKYLYFADETHGTSINILDISNPWSLTNVGSFKSALLAPTYVNSVPHNMHVRDTLLFVSYYQDGLQVWNISNPASPVKEGHYDTYINTDYSGLMGAWGVYAGLPSGNILVSDMVYGLFVLQMNTSLPLRIVDFEARAKQGLNELEWTVADEVGMDAYQVERSLDGSDFQNIGHVMAQGASQGNQSYVFQDFGVAPGRTYYRLRMQDAEGHESLSEIRVVDALFELELGLFPNPVQSSGELRLNMNLSGPANVMLSVTDMMGRAMHRDQLELHSGFQQHAIQIENWAQGTYCLKMEGSGISMVKQVVVQ